ncbi:MAG: hypothetical protein ACU4EQ_00825 [Candidatus Nitrosoglobus sp.]
MPPCCWIRPARYDARPGVHTFLAKVVSAKACAAYQRFQKLIKSDFLEQQQRGAWVQRLLWQAPYMGMPGYSDLFYVEALIGEDTAISMNSKILDVFQHYGEIRSCLEESFSEAGLDFRVLKVVDVE